MDNIKKYSILVSYAVGLPIGLITVFVLFALPVLLTGEGFATIIFLEIFGKATVGLLVSFIVALWFGGVKVLSDINRSNSLLKTSFNYSIRVNTIIWIIFMIIFLIENYQEKFTLTILLPFIGYLLSVGVTTFTIGLLISYLVKRQAGITSPI